MNLVHGFTRPVLLPAYYYATLPVRRIGLATARLLGKSPIAVIYYHRVADRAPNPWTISNRAFQQQIDWLSQRYEFVSLAEAQRRLSGGRNRRPAVCITFDDGYAENCEQALPWLIERRIPVNYFVASQYILNGTPFPHDVARGEPLAPNSVAQIRSLADSGIEIGAHTRTHADLGLIADRDRLWNEIAGSRDDLQQILGRDVRYFAFPFGLHQNLSAAAVEAVRDAGFAGYCSAYGGYNFPRSDVFHLQRMHGDPDWARFTNWLSFDPRIALGVRRWNPEQKSAAARHLTNQHDSNLRRQPCVPLFRRATAVDGNDR